ncbi:MAG: hypothetical protein ACJAUV_000115 [Flavobacteriales bacterium]|jgi:hypothetical protein
MEKDWVCIYKNSFVPKVELINQLLLDNNIEGILLNKQDSSYHTFGEAEIYVHQSNVLKAKHILENE